MDPERFALAQRLFDEVVDLDEPRRSSRLRELTTDASLQAFVLELLHESQSRESGFGEGVLRAIDDLDTPDVNAGDTFGAWRVVRPIGQGGMGSVFLVERNDGHFAQTAALKLLKGLPRADGLAYFTRERQLLASLTHPNIARLLDGGASPQGQPYLVMEFVDGVPIDQHCRDKGLKLKEILDLFVTACSAVAFAHRRLIVHCDLKPSNLLVDKDGRPVLLDFGIARLIDHVGQDQAVRGVDSPAGAAFTPRYASPEQSERGTITTASDIFSLGVMLGELLDPGQHTTSGTLGLDPELRAIIRKATCSEPADRYATVDALCQDIDRFLTFHPVLAVPSTRRYRARKFVRRRWSVVAASAAFLVMATAFTTRIVVESRRARAAEAAAVIERDRAMLAETAARSSENSAREVSKFLTSVFEGSNPDAGSGTVSTAVLLDQAFARVGRDLSHDPPSQAQMYAALAGVQATIERSKDALATYEKAIAIERRAPRPLVLARMLIDISALRLKDVHGPEMIAEAREALALVETRAEGDSGLRLEATVQLAVAVDEFGDAAEATALFERAVALGREVAPNSLALASALGGAGLHQRRLGHHELAVALFREQMALIEKLTSPGDEEQLGALENLGGALSDARLFDESESTFRRAIQHRRDHGSIETKAGAWNLAELARMLVNVGRPLEAIPLFKEAIAIADRKFASDGGTRAAFALNLGNAAERAGDFALWGVAMKRGITLASRVWKGPSMARTEANYGRFLLGTGSPAEAESWARRAISGLESTRKADDASVLGARILLARILRERKQMGGAERELAFVASHRSNLSPENSARLTHLSGLLAYDAGRIDEGLKLMIDGEAAMLKALGPKDARSYLIRLDRAELLRARGARSSASTVARELIENVEARLDPASPYLARIRRLL